MTPPQPWNAATATRTINAIARDLACTMSHTLHAKGRMAERELIIGDILYVLRNGMVYGNEPEESTLPGFYKYRIESQSPNSGPRYLRVVAVPDHIACQIKVITIMWRDEK